MVYILAKSYMTQYQYALLKADDTESEPTYIANGFKTIDQAKGYIAIHHLPEYPMYLANEYCEVIQEVY